MTDYKLTQSQLKSLAPFCHYIWWKTPEQVIRQPQRLIAQIMNLGVFEDVMTLRQIIDKDILLHVLQNAEAGQFDPPSWHYWHYILTDCQPGEVPPLPKRKCALTT